MWPKGQIVQCLIEGVDRKELTMSMQSQTKFTVVNLDGVRIMGAPAVRSQYKPLEDRRAQRAKLDLPPIMA